MNAVEDFAGVFAILAFQLQKDADAVTIAAYHQALEDLPLSAVSEAGKDIGRELNRKFFPSSGEWRAKALASQKTTLQKLLPKAREQPWRHECQTCEDSGWVLSMSCPETPCERETPHGTHTYTRACVCRGTNRTYQRNMSHQTSR